jgi:hypothetical protein
VARRVDFHDVERTRPVSRQFDTGVALPTRGVGRPFGTIETASEDSG